MLHEDAFADACPASSTVVFCGRLLFTLYILVKDTYKDKNPAKQINLLARTVLFPKSPRG